MRSAPALEQSKPKAPARQKTEFGAGVIAWNGLKLAFALKTVDAITLC